MCQGFRPAEPGDEAESDRHGHGSRAGTRLTVYIHSANTPGVGDRAARNVKGRPSQSRQSGGGGDSTEVTSELRPEVKRHVDVFFGGERVVLAERTESAKVLRWEQAWCV